MSCKCVHRLCLCQAVEYPLYRVVRKDYRCERCGRRFFSFSYSGKPGALPEMNGDFRYDRREE